jgi:hypothetical protein
MEELKQAAGVVLSADAWPFWSTVLVFTIIGQFTSTKLFTRERAYQEHGAAWKNHLWWWGRETLMLHPIAAGAALGALWQDPQGQGWPLVGSMMYFGVAGVLSLGAWAAIRGFAKKKGVDLKLPGQSSPPGG